MRFPSMGIKQIKRSSPVNARGVIESVVSIPLFENFIFSKSASVKSVLKDFPSKLQNFFLEEMLQFLSGSKISTFKQG